MSDTTEPRFNGAVVATARHTIQEVQRVCPPLRDVDLIFTWSERRDTGPGIAVPGLMRSQRLPGLRKVLVVLQTATDDDAGPYELMLATDPPEGFGELGYGGTMIAADAIRLAITAEAVRLLSGDEHTLTAVLEAMHLTPETVGAAVRVLGGAIGPAFLAMEQHA